MSSDSPPTISVVIPVYRAERLLQRCVDSLLVQTYPQLEIILVEDGSPDRSAALCDTYAAKDTRIRVIHQANSGPGAARNRGMEAATGEFICFVDADDYVDRDYISHFVEGLGEGVDLVFQGMNAIRRDGVLAKIPKAKLYESTELSEAIADINRHAMFGYVWNKLFRKSVISEHKLRFRQDINLSEDRIFALEYMLYAGRMQIIEKAAYYYRPHENGLTLRRHSYQALKTAAEANLQAALQLLKRSPSERFLRDTQRMYVMSATGALLALFRDRESLPRCVAAFRTFRSTAQQWLPLYRPSSRDQRMLYTALCCPPLLGATLMKLYQSLKNLKHEIRP